jgi:hypothetical protein
MRGRGKSRNQITVAVTERCWAKIMAHALKHHLPLGDVIDGIVIDIVPLETPKLCSLCSKAGHPWKKCPQQIELGL